MIICIERRMSGGYTIEHIAQLRWRNTTDNNTDWSTVTTLVEWIEAGNKLYCQRPNGHGDPVIVLVERPPGRRPFLRTAPNNTPADNLLALPTG